MRQIRGSRTQARKLNDELARLENRLEELAADTNDPTVVAALDEVQTARLNAAQHGLGEGMCGPYDAVTGADWQVLLTLADNANENTTHGTVERPGGTRIGFALIQTLMDWTTLCDRQVRRSTAALHDAGAIRKFGTKDRRASSFRVVDLVTPWTVALADAGVFSALRIDPDTLLADEPEAVSDAPRPLKAVPDLPDLPDVVDGEMVEDAGASSDGTGHAAAMAALNAAVGF